MTETKEWPRELFYPYGVGSFLGTVKYHWTMDCRYVRDAAGGAGGEEYSSPDQISVNERCKICWPKKYLEKLE